MSMVESGVYVGAVPPWVNCGVKVDEALSSQQAIKMAGLDWTVDAQPIQVVGGQVIDGMKANVRSSDHKVLGVVSDRYKIVQNADAFAFTDILLGEGVKYETAGSLSSGKRVWLLAKMETSKVCGDDVEPYLVFTNSHDGSGAVKVAVTPIRVVCQNTLTLALSTAKRTWSTKHCGDIQGKMDDAQNTLGFAASYMENLKEEADKLTQVVVLAPQFADFLMKMFPTNSKMSERQIANVENQRKAVAEIYNHKDDIQKFHGTVYGVLNAVADYLPHGLPSRITSSYRENNFMNIVDGGKTNIMDMACAYFNV